MLANHRGKSKNPWMNTRGQHNTEESTMTHMRKIQQDNLLSKCNFKNKSAI